MRYFVIGLIFFLIIVNFSLFFIGRKHASNISDDKEASDKEFKKGKNLVEYIDTYFKDNGGTC